MMMDCCCKVDRYKDQQVHNQFHRLKANVKFRCTTVFYENAKTCLRIIIITYILRSLSLQYITYLSIFISILSLYIYLTHLMRRLHICTHAVIPVLLIGGIELIPTSAYGVRLYTNGSSMVMHNDKVSCDDYDDDDDINNDDDDDYMVFSDSHQFD